MKFVILITIKNNKNGHEDYIMNKFARPTMLMILDGFGINKSAHGNAIAAAHKPNIDQIFETFPHTTLKACGLDD